MLLDVPAVLAQLAPERPVFHSEADFQHALAWTIQLRMPDARIRLESRPERGIHLDIFVRVGTDRCAIELKYWTARLDAVVDGERFALPNHGAQDLARYDFCKDIWRLETMVADGYADTGWAVALTNDSSLWRPGVRADPIDAAFRLHQGRTLTGDLAWHLRTGGTSKGRESVLPLCGRHECQWAPYSRVERSAAQASEFRHLAVPVVGGQ